MKKAQLPYRSIILSLLTLASPALAEPRTWTNQEGKTIEAEFQATDGTNVTILMNGKERRMALSSLSDEDQAWIAAQKEDVVTESPAGPLRVLLLTGGCCHDYEDQKMILSAGIQQRANTEFTILHEGGDGDDHQFALLKKEGWEKDFDAVLYNICFAREKDKKYIESITNTHMAGLPAVALHCTMHSYHWDAKTDDWEKFLGVTSPNHGPQAAIEVTPKKADHPVMIGFPESWKTPNGELYNIKKVWSSATVLAEGDNGESKQPCVWVNDFKGTRVFGTTIGHHNETIETEVYLDLVTRGLLWVTGRLTESGEPADGMDPRTP